MTRFPIALCAVLILSCLCGCGNKSSGAGTSKSSTPPVRSGGSKFDSGPRADEQDVDDRLAKAGSALFKDKGCSACHTFGARLSGPDLAGVTTRRTALWMKNQILHPEVMAKEDPISRELVGIHALQMPNQGLTPEQARSVIEYLKHRDHEASEKGGTRDPGDSKEGD